MRYRRVGDSDLIVSEICLGTMTYGEQNTEADTCAQLSFAWDHGVNCLDTAEMYAVPTRPESEQAHGCSIAGFRQGCAQGHLVIDPLGIFVYFNNRRPIRFERLAHSVDQISVTAWLLPQTATGLYQC